MPEFTFSDSVTTFHCDRARFVPPFTCSQTCGLPPPSGYGEQCCYVRIIGLQRSAGDLLSILVCMYPEMESLDALGIEVTIYCGNCHMVFRRSSTIQHSHQQCSEQHFQNYVHPRHQDWPLQSHRTIEWCIAPQLHGCGGEGIRAGKADMRGNVVSKGGVFPREGM